MRQKAHRGDFRGFKVLGDLKTPLSRFQESGKRAIARAKARAF